MVAGIVLCLPIIGAALWGSGVALDGSPESFLEVSVATAVLCVGWALLAAASAYGSRVVCHVGLRGHRIGRNAERALP